MTCPVTQRQRVDLNLGLFDSKSSTLYLLCQLAASFFSLNSVVSIPSSDSYIEYCSVPLPFLLQTLGYTIVFLVAIIKDGTQDQKHRSSCGPTREQASGTITSLISDPSRINISFKSHSKKFIVMVSKLLFSKLGITSFYYVTIAPT